MEETNFSKISIFVQDLIEENIGLNYNEIKHETCLFKYIINLSNLPLSQCRYLKPFTDTKWDLMKHPSDTATKMIDCVNAIIPVNGAQGSIIYRLFRHCACSSLINYQALTSRSIDIETASVFQ